jgi:hypothetical protein
MIELRGRKNGREIEREKEERAREQTNRQNKETDQSSNIAHERIRLFLFNQAEDESETE